MRRLIVTAALLALVTTVLILGGPAVGQTGLSVAVGHVVEVHDGDTFTIAYLAGGEFNGKPLPTKIRPYLINAPEINGSHEGAQCYGDEARQYADKLLGDRTVWLIHHQGDKDRYGRLLAFVYVDSDQQALFQALMISQGFAREDARHPVEEALVNRMHDLVLEAQRARRGMWEACVSKTGPPEPKVFINEIELDPVGSDLSNEWVELYNATNKDVDLSGWQIVAIHGVSKTVTIPQGTKVTANEFAVIQPPKRFLDNEQEMVELRNADGAVVDQTRELTDTKDDLRCWARVPDGNDAWEFQTCSRGQSNGLLLYDPRASSQ